MDEAHQDETGSKSIAAEDVRWVFNKRSKLWVPQHKKRKWFRRWKTFESKFPFDWLNLIGVLAIPFVVTVVGLYFTQQITQQQAQSSERQHQTDLQIAQDQQRETLLQNYLDHMSDLLLNSNLLESKPGDAVRQIAQARTLFTLRQLDSTRKSSLLEFLYHAQLIQAPKSASDHNNPIISLANADLRGIKLRGSHLTLPHILPFGCPDSNQSTFDNLSIPDFSGVDLSEANLSGANISCVIMKGVNLSRANLLGTRLVDVDLSGADLRYAFIGCNYISSPLRDHILRPLSP